jgi:hypothetical protein
MPTLSNSYKYEDKALKYLQGTKYDQQYIRSKIATSPEDEKLLAETYSIFSNYASHPHSVKSMVSVMTKVQGNKIGFFTYPVFNKEEARVCYGHFVNWYWVSINQLHATYSSRLKANRNWMVKYAEWKDIFTKFMREFHEANQKFIETGTAF